MAKVTISVQLDTDNATDLVVGEKLGAIMDALDFSSDGGKKAPAKEEAVKATRTRGGKAAPKEEEEPAAKTTRTRGGKAAPTKKAGDALEELREEGRVIMDKVVDSFRKDIKEEFKFYGVDSISDFTNKDDLAEFVTFLKELEEDLEEEEEEEEPAPRRKPRGK